MEVGEFLFGFLLGWLTTLVAAVLSMAGFKGMMEGRRKRERE